MFFPQQLLKFKHFFLKLGSESPGGREAAEPGKDKTPGQSAQAAGKTFLVDEAGRTSQAAEPESHKKRHYK